MRAARWSYQVRATNRATADFRNWPNGVLGFFDEPQRFIPYGKQKFCIIAEVDGCGAAG